MKCRGEKCSPPGGCIVYQRIICILIIVCVVFTGCGVLKPEKNFEKMSKRLLKLTAYTCDVTMRVTNNKSTMEYKLKHFYKSPDKYRVEILAPKELEGQVTIYNGSSSYIYHPGINQYLVTENFSGSVEYNAFIGSFMDHIRKTDDIKVSIEKEGEKELIVLEFEVLEPNNYMRMEKLWIDAEAIVPIKAEIYGNDGKTTVSVGYNNFVYNPNLDDRDFIITNEKSMKLQEMKENVRSEENQSCMGGGRPGCSCPQHEGGKTSCTEECTCNCSH
jgi:outer membrane lipoprotein-sorting protein